MRHHHDVRAALFVTVVALLLVLSAASAPAASTSLALVGGTIYYSPTDAPIANGVVVMRDGKIVAVGPKSAVQIPAGTETLDCTGSTITAGFWNSHVHFMERKWSDAAKIPPAELTRELQGMLTQYGFTNVFDTGSMLENTRAIRDRIESGEVLGPRIRTTGPIIYPKGGAGTPEILDVIGFMHSSMPEVSTPDEARAAAKQSLDGGSDAIKLYAALWYPPFTALPEDAMRAAVD
jgi:imidazolonepropionase-like amidohydrolase